MNTELAPDQKTTNEPEPGAYVPDELDELPPGIILDTRDPVEMLESVVSYLRQYLVCDDHQLNLLALWIVHTWSFQYFSTVSYLDIRSPEPQSGKTRCLELLKQLCQEPELIAGASPKTLSVQMLRDRNVIEIDFEENFLLFPRPWVYLLDDSQHTFAPGERQSVVAMLNSGCRHSSRYMLGEHEYALFGPKAFAGNGQLPRSLASRCIPIILRRKKPSEVVARFDPEAQPSPSLSALRDWLDMVSDNPQWIAEFAEQNPPNLPSSLTARQHDCAEPLFHIADAIGGPWPERARAAIVWAFGRAESSEPVQVLEDIRNCFQLKENPEYLLTRDLLSLLSDYEDRPWSAWPRNSGRRLGVLLQPFGIKSHTIKAEALKGYRLSDFKDVWERYLPPTAPPADSTSVECEAREQSQGKVSQTVSVTPSVTTNSIDHNDLQSR